MGKFDSDQGDLSFDVFDMRDHKKNRDNEADCKWRCDNNYRCARYAYDASTLFCKMYEKPKDDSNHGGPAFDEFDMRDHKKNRDNQGDCKWRCDNNYRCARYEYDASTLFCKLFEKSKDGSHQTEPFDAFDMRDHPKNRDHEGDCKWRCDNNDQCARYEYDATTLICKMFEKSHVKQDDSTSGEDDKDDKVLIVKQSKSGVKHNYDDGDEDDKKSIDEDEEDDEDDEDDQAMIATQSQKGVKHNADKDEQKNSDNDAKNDKG